jgi:hypothetical protein
MGLSVMNMLGLSSSVLFFFLLPAKLSLYSTGTDRTEKVSFIIAYCLFAGEATFPSNGCVLSPAYTDVTWQWIYTSQYSSDK